MRDKLTEAVGKPHLSYSSLKYALGDMRLWEMYMRGQLKKTSDALIFGTLYDMLLFETDKAMEEYQVIDTDQILAGCSQKTQDSKSPHLNNQRGHGRGGQCKRQDAGIWRGLEESTGDDPTLKGLRSIR